MEPSPPLLVNDHGDLWVYSSVGDVQCHLEAIDVRNEEYVAYDAQGRLLQLSATENDDVIVELAESVPAHAQELERIIRDFLRRLQDPAGEDPTYSLPKLVEYCRKFIETRREPKYLMRLRTMITRIKAFFKFGG